MPVLTVDDHCVDLFAHCGDHRIVLVIALGERYSPVIHLVDSLLYHLLHPRDVCPV